MQYFANETKYYIREKGRTELLDVAQTHVGLAAICVIHYRDWGSDRL